MCFSHVSRVAMHDTHNMQSPFTKYILISFVERVFDSCRKKCLPYVFLHDMIPLVFFMNIHK